MAVDILELKPMVQGIPIAPDPTHPQLVGMVGFVLDLIVPVEGTGGLPLGFRLPIVLSCTTLFFWVLGTASKPSMAWRSFLAAFKSPRIAGRLHWAPLRILLDGWAERERDFSWVMLGVPVTASLYNQALLSVGSLLSVVLAVFLRNS